MSLFIKGKNQPATCSKCPCCYNYECFNETKYFCTAKDDAPDIKDISAGILPVCPIVIIPEEHGRLIDEECLLDNLKEVIKRIDKNDMRLFISDFIKIIRSTPTFIEAERKG